MKKLVIVCVCFVKFASAQIKSDSSIIKFIQQRTDSLFQKNKVPAIAINISKNGKRYFYTKGFANVETKATFTPYTIFEIGSITKTFTAFIVQKVLDDNNISDTTSIISYLPDSVQTNKALAKINFLQLLNHTSGLARIPEDMEMNSTPYDNYTLNKVFSYLKKCTINPNGKSNYSNLGMGLAGILAARIAKKEFTLLVREYIVLPFRMIEKTNSKPVLYKSQGYFTEKEKSSYWNMSALMPCGGLQMNSNKLLYYLQYMINPVDKKNSIIIDKIMQPTIALNKQISIAKGWHILYLDNNTIYWHNGGTYGFSTFCAFNKKNNTAVTVVVNQFNKNDIADLLGVMVMKKLCE